MLEGGGILVKAREKKGWGQGLRALWGNPE